MIHWVFRIVWAMAGAITGWFVAQGATNFTWIQVVISLLLIALFVFLAAFWPSLVRWLDREQRPR